MTNMPRRPRRRSEHCLEAAQTTITGSPHHCHRQPTPLLRTPIGALPCVDTAMDRQSCHSTPSDSTPRNSTQPSPTEPNPTQLNSIQPIPSHPIPSQHSLARWHALTRTQTFFAGAQSWPYTVMALHSYGPTQSWLYIVIALHSHGPT